MQKGMEWMSTQFSIRHFEIKDLYSKCKDYPFLLESVPTPVKGEIKDHTEVLRVEVKVNPLDGKADLAVDVRN